MRRYILWAIGLIFVFNITLQGQQVGNEGPDFEVNVLDGDQFKLSDQQGKVVLIYLFGNSCPFCIASGPTVESTLFKAFIDNPNFTAVGLDTWNNSSNTASVTSFKSKTGITFPLAIKAGFVATDYQTTYDRLLVIDHNGILVHKGLVPAGNDINNALQAIETSLASIPSDPCENAEINITYVDSPPSCPGESDGSIDITVTGSYPAFSYSWSNGFNTEDIMGLSEGSFNVTVTDSEECTASLEIILDEPPIMSITEKVYNPSCAIDTFGSIKIDVSGGAGPYEILWPYESTNDSISGLTEGCYSVEVTDANECLISKTICITIPEPLMVEHTITDIACNGDNSGSIFVQVNGGTPPYKTILADQEFHNVFENLGAGEYNLNVTDARSCMTLVSITIVEPEEIFVGEISGITDVNEFQTYNYSVPESENFLFNWSVEGGSIVSGQGTNTVNIQWTSNTEGLVKTIAESESGCLSDTASLVVSIQITTGAEDRSTVRVSVYPNPAGDKLYVSSDNEVFVSIYDITGQLQISTINKLIDLSQLNKGSYFVSIRSQNLLHKVRILKL